MRTTKNLWGVAAVALTPLSGNFCPGISPVDQHRGANRLHSSHRQSIIVFVPFDLFLRRAAGHERLRWMTRGRERNC